MAPRTFLRLRLSLPDPSRLQDVEIVRGSTTVTTTRYLVEYVSFLEFSGKGSPVEIEVTLTVFNRIAPRVIDVNRDFGF